jgi:integrin beta 3
MLDPDALAEMMAGIIEEHVAKAVAPLNARIADLEARPAPEKGEPGEDGKSIDPAAVEEMVASTVAKAVAELPKPKDGNDGKDAANIVEALKDSGELVLTLQDGRLIRTGIRDGKDGERGNDGFGFDDLDVAVLDDDRTIEFAFRRGEEEKAFTIKWPTVIYRGVFNEGAEYAPGDMVTWAGSLWHCDVSTKFKPGTETWTLACKKGRDGKDAKNG